MKFIYLYQFLLSCLRSSGGIKVHYESHGTAAADWPAALLCHPHVRHHRPRLLHGQVSSDLLQDRHRYTRGAVGVEKVFAFNQGTS